MENATHFYEINYFIRESYKNQSRLIFGITIDSYALFNSHHATGLD